MDKRQQQQTHSERRPPLSGRIVGNGTATIHIVAAGIIMRSMIGSFIQHRPLSGFSKSPALRTMASPPACSRKARGAFRKLWPATFHGDPYSPLLAYKYHCHPPSLPHPSLQVSIEHNNIWGALGISFWPSSRTRRRWRSCCKVCRNSSRR